MYENGQSKTTKVESLFSKDYWRWSESGQLAISSVFIHVEPKIILDPISKWSFIEKSMANMTVIGQKLVYSTKMTLIWIWLTMKIFNLAYIYNNWRNFFRHKGLTETGKMNSHWTAVLALNRNICRERPIVCWRMTTSQLSERPVNLRRTAISQVSERPVIFWRTANFKISEQPTFVS